MFSIKSIRHDTVKYIPSREKIMQNRHRVCKNATKMNNIIHGNRCHRYYPAEINHNVILDHAALLLEVTI